METENIISTLTVEEKIHLVVGKGSMQTDSANGKIKPVYMADKLDALKELPVDIYRFEFTDETKSECEKILSEYENSVSDIKVNTFTRGHYFRGVL